MGKSIYLLRHAKSDWSDLSLDDHDRPLKKRGRQAAPAIGRYLAAYLKENSKRIDVILCSSAVRTQQTLHYLLDALSQNGKTALDQAGPAIEVNEALYMASAARMHSMITALPEQYDSILLIAHNPGMEILASNLTENRSHPAFLAMQEKYVTAGLALFHSDHCSWSDCTPGVMTLADFINPRTL